MTWQVEYTDEFGAWWATLVPVADRIFDEHLKQISEEPTGRR
jgi:hypothetical protein